MQLFKLSEGTAARRRMYLHLVDSVDGISVETGEAGGQPQYSKNGAAFGSTSATLTAVGQGMYYVELTAGELDTLGVLAIRYKSANTAEFQDVASVVAYDPYSAALGLTIPAAADNADAVWDELKAGHAVADSFGDYLDDEISSRPTAADNADAVWDEAQADHLIVGSLGESMKNTAKVLRTQTAVGGGASTITLDGGAAGDANAYNNCTISILGGSGIGQSRNIEAYDFATQIVTVHLPWDTTPDATSIYQITAGYSVWDEDVLNAHVEADSAGEALQAAKDSSASADTSATAALASAGSVLLSGLTTAGGTTTRLNDTVNLAGAFTDQYKGCRLKAHGGDNEAIMRYIIASGDGYIEVFPPLPVAVLTGWFFTIYASAPIAEVVLGMDIANVESYAAVHSMLTACLKLVGKTQLESIFLRIYQTDGVTSHATQVRTIDTGLQPTSGLGGAV